MHHPSTIPALPLSRIFHPSDYTQASDIAFAHALKLALITKAELRLMHVAIEDDDDDWHDFTSVRATLAQWGVLPADSAREEVGRLGLSVKKVQATQRNPVKAILYYLERHPAELLVLATHQRQGFGRLFHQAVAEPIARDSATMALFLPPAVEGFVSLAKGAVTLQRILIPVAAVPRPRLAIEAAAGLAVTLGCERVAFTLVYVGDAGGMPAIHPPERQGWTWERVIRRGRVVQQVLDVAQASAADLMVLTTQGHQSLFDTLRGSTFERILHRAPCPVLAVPAE